jgi:hypothetical protein
MTISTTRLRRTALVGLLASSALISAQAAMASDTLDTQANQSLSIEQASQYLHYSGGNDRYRVELAPNYSEELGFSMKGAVGGYLTDAMALGLIVEYGENKREYLANAGIQFNDALSFVGTVGMLEEHNEYVDGEDREKVQQMEYGASLKGAYEVGFLSGFELNGYLADADADSDSVETGKLYGVQLLADFDLTSTTHIEIGGGYEWLEWDDTNDDDSRWTFSAEAAQQLGDVVSLTGHAKLGASEFVYGGGVAFDLSNGGMNTNTLGVSYSYIDGKNGIEDDQRVELAWSYGFGAGPTQTASVETQDAGAIRPVADVAMVSSANNLLNDVMKRPSYLPEQVVARASIGGTSCLPLTVIAYADVNSFADRDYLQLTPTPVGAVLGQGFSLTVNGLTREWGYGMLGSDALFGSYDVIDEFPAFAEGETVTVRLTDANNACYEGSAIAVPYVFPP